MYYKNLADAIKDLEKEGELITIDEQVSPDLEMAAIHRQIFDSEGPAILYKNVDGSKYSAVSNLFGTLKRSKYLLRHQWDAVQQLVSLKIDPMQALKSPLKFSKAFQAGLKMRPKKVSYATGKFQEIQISDLPNIKSWPDDGGGFITLPQVYSEDVTNPGKANGNLGMYRIQLGGNDYIVNKEVGLHYQIHRGIGVHQSKAKEQGEDLKVSIFVGGPPAHTLAAVMPLPEGLSELMFAGAMNGRRFRYAYDSKGYLISIDADFVICGTIAKEDLKKEGPFGDHLGYYSLRHDFPYLKVDKVLAKKDAIWPFTVVGRPPAEDSQFGAVIHELTGAAIPSELPGVQAVHAVDESGVHPLLLAIGSERYTPFLENSPPMELLIQANAILGFGQLSLAKYLFIIDKNAKKDLDIHEVPNFITAVLERLDLSRDLHFQTETSIDTLDYSGTAINQGSKLVIAARGKAIRELSTKPVKLEAHPSLKALGIVNKGILALEIKPFTSYKEENENIKSLISLMEQEYSKLDGYPLVLLCDDLAFLQKSYSNFIWQAFTRSNPSHDVHGLFAETVNKHWKCEHAMIWDIRKKPHHAPELIKDQQVEERAFKKWQAAQKS